jgi:CRP/FNR family transcriptional regulator
MRGFAATVGDLAFRSVLERLAQFIEASAAPLGQSLSADVSVDLGLTQEQLAARLGTVRELVARSLAQLEKSGIIRRSRSVVTIRDPARLAALSRGDPEVP